MALLVPNNPNGPTAIMTAIRDVILPQTALAATTPGGTGTSRVYFEEAFTLAQGIFPAVRIAYGEQKYKKQSRSTWIGETPYIITYFDRWDSQPNTLDSVYAGITADILRMYANLESNDRLTTNGVSAVQTLKKISLSPYYGEVAMTTIPGISLVFREITILCVINPYDV